ncbi:YpdA family putative bacillithiol disulfide reductase [Alicyclobacillus hesperidum]|uniref:YpdA family putative bacillithiol disulfide reductase n=1 Tax=Alicyclobacillus hesperidum TaxID=89784 RepID=UPI002490FF62|nr:YpdA family putative bacillithiol disulfide reductase [Alicyclobacillus hesperidum]
MYDVCVIGAGPCGLAVSVELQKRQIDHVVLEKSCIASTIYRFPTQMIFNSTPERLEIADIPFYTQGGKPTRQEALNYYRTVVARLKLPIRQYETVEQVAWDDGQMAFSIQSRTLAGQMIQTFARQVVIATGYFDHPNALGVPGEELPHVQHYYRDAHPYYGQRVVIVGGTNSAAEAAIDLYRVGAEVTLIHRGAALSDKIKPWVRPEIQSLIDHERIAFHFRSRVKAILPDRVQVATPEGDIEIAADHVLALIGYHPDTPFLSELGVEIDAESGIPTHHPETYETNVAGIFIAGVVVSGYDANRIFIENGRLHAPAIAQAIRDRLGSRI